MDIMILTAVVMAGIALESFSSKRARRREQLEDVMNDRPARYANRDLN